MTTIKGTLVYNPVTLVDTDKRVTLVRKQANQLLYELLATRSGLQGKLLKACNKLQETTADPHAWCVTKTSAPAAKDIHKLWGVAEAVADLQGTTPEALTLQAHVAELRKSFILGASAPGWAILAVPENAVDEHVRTLRAQGTHVSKSLWGPHVSVVRGERTKPGRWGDYAGTEYEIRLGTEIKTNETGYHWLPCESRDLEALRLHLGLPPRPSVPFHLTIGHTQQGQTNG